MSEITWHQYRYKQKSHGDVWTGWYLTQDPDARSAAERVCYYTSIQEVDDTITIEHRRLDKDTGKYTYRTFVWELGLREA